MSKDKSKLIATGSEWSYDKLEEGVIAIEDIGRNVFKLDTYPTQYEIISSEQMLEAYATHALPLYYDHWSLGMQFVQEMEHYKRGRMGLAYEVVINSNPCIAYLMEENTMLMQLLVSAHAGQGHNHFFKNNYMFRQWTDADSIIDYLAFAKKYINDCEERYGIDEVEEVLDAAHALQHFSIDKYKRPRELTRVEREEQKKEREEWERQQVNVLWSTLPDGQKKRKKKIEEEDIFPDSPQENILYFIEKNAPNLDTWKREVIRIVRKLGQYFYPQMQTQLMNEGFATFMHYHILYEMYDRGMIDDGYVQEFLHSHTGVIKQPDFDETDDEGRPIYSGINVYALGFAMYMDIKRVSMKPTEEDLNWFKGKEWVGNGKWLDNILWAAANFKDESFVTEFLSPTIMRKFKLFAILDDDQESKLEVAAIHNDAGYRKVREALSHQYNLGYKIPEIQVAEGGVDRWGDRSLTLQHIIRERRPLDQDSAMDTLKHGRTLWGYDVKLDSIETDGTIRASYEVADDDTLLDVFRDDD